MWNVWLDLIRASIFAAAHVCGGSLGGGVLVVSFAMRLGLLPLTLKMARRARDQQRRLVLIQSELTALQKRHAKDRARLVRETQALYRQHGIRLLHPMSLLGTAAQIPLLAGLFSAVRAGLGQRVRFAWIADLSRANGILVLVVAALSATASALAPVPPPHAAASTALVMVSAIMAAVVLWSASSAVALSWGAGAVVSILQNAILARDVRRERSAKP
jgi:YidC/Oxa1 family membrane protein insertase